MIMNTTTLFILLLFFLFLNAEAQRTLATDYDSSQSSTSSFQPSLAVVVGVLFLMFTVTFFLLIYAKFCHRTASAVHVRSPNLPGLVRSGSGYSGIDKTVIESLPFFRFSSLRGEKEGLECAVCLSKFEDIEILRLLPKCKHAFHINCVDQWLESHSSCPICRCKVSPEDPTLFTYTNSMRFVGNQTGLREDSNIELFVQREENRQGSSRFSIGGSFQKGAKFDPEEQSLIKETEDKVDSDKRILNKYNHRIIVSDVVFKNRWSNLSSSDLVFLNSELLNEISSNRFSAVNVDGGQNTRRRAAEDEQIAKIKEEIEIKRLFENKVNSININSSVAETDGGGFPSTSATSGYNTSRTINSDGRRSVSEITVFSRSRNLGVVNNMIRGGSSSSDESNNVKEERLRRMWLPIAKRTAQWFVNRERRSQHTETDETTRRTLVV